MSDGFHGHGAVLTVNDATNTTTVGNIISIGGPSQARDPIDISTVDSASKFREFVPGMLDAGEVTMEINYDGTAAGTADKLNTLKTATAMTWTVTIDDAATTAQTNSSWACAGFVTALGHAIPFDDKVTQSVTIKCTGLPTYLDIA
jgi:predicted secreted protein